MAARRPLISRYRSGVAWFLLLGIAGCAGLELNRPFRAGPDDWTQMGGDAGRRQVATELPAMPWKRLWEYNAQAGMLATPLVRDSIAILGTLHGELQAVDLRTGKRIGYTKTGAPVHGTPALNGPVVYVPMSTQTRPSLAAIDIVEGERRWEVSVGPIESSPLFDRDRVFVATLEGRLLCLDAASGEERWRYQVGTKADRKPIRSSPAMVGGIVVFGSDAAVLTGLDASTGRFLWSVRLSGSIFAGVAGSEGLAVVGDVLGRVVGVDASSGDVRWTREMGSPVYAAAAIEGGTCYVPVGDGRVVALDLANGDERWTFRALSVVNASPLVAGSRLLVPSLDRSVSVVDRVNGTLVERIEVEGRVKVTPVVWRHTVLLACEDKSVIAYTSGESR